MYSKSPTNQKNSQYSIHFLINQNDFYKYLLLQKNNLYSKFKITIHSLNQNDFWHLLLKKLICIQKIQQIRKIQKLQYSILSNNPNWHLQNQKLQFSNIKSYKLFHYFLMNQNDFYISTIKKINLYSKSPANQKSSTLSNNPNWHLLLQKSNLYPKLQKSYFTTF